MALQDLAFVNPQTSGSAGLGAHHARIPAVGVAELPMAAQLQLADLPVEIAGAGRLLGLEEFVGLTHSTSLLIAVRGKVVLEWYADGLGPTDRFLGASMTKSVLACLVGRAVAAGRLGLDDAVATHVPELADTGYEQVTVGQLGAMTSGVEWAEDYRDRTSPASGLIEVFGSGSGGSRDLLRQIGPAAAPGSRFAYSTADSQVLDWVRERATGATYAEALTDLWRLLGATEAAFVGLDAPSADGGVALAGGGLCATTRDWARVGILQLDGTVDGEQILSPTWIDASLAPSARFLEPGRLPSTLTAHAGFGFHWWPLTVDGRRVTADGSRGQFTYVDRDLEVVVVKTSQWPYDEPTDRQCRDLTYLALPDIARSAALLPDE